MQALRKAAGGLAAALVAGALVSAGPAAASGPLTVIDFFGTCADCSGTGHGVLTVQNFGSGVLDASNFVDWTYTSNLVTYEVAADDLHAFSADFTKLPLAAVSIEQATTGPKGSDGSFHDFMSDIPGPGDTVAWDVDGFIPGPGGVELPIGGGGVINDVGPSYTWQVRGAVPEPAAWALMIAGFGVAGAGLRGARRRRSTASA